MRRQDFNCRAQLGKIISTFPVMLLISLIIGGYLILTGFAYGVKGQEIPDFLENAGAGDDALLRSIKFDKDGAEENILVFDAIARYWLKKDISKENIESALTAIVNSDAREGDCLAIAQGTFGDGIPHIQNDVYHSYLIGYKASLPNNPARIFRELEKYDKEGLFRKISFFNPEENKLVYVNYYYGRCLNE